MTQVAEDLFDKGLERYRAGESAPDLIPVFKEICDKAPRNSSAWTCLAWLYLLDDKPKSALKAAQKAVKLNQEDPQARVNLVAAMLETGQKGVREHIDVANSILAIAPEFREEVKQNCEEGLSRKPDWDSLKRIQGWLFGEA